MALTYEDFYGLANVKQHREFEDYLRRIIFEPDERKKFYKGLIDLGISMREDTFREYFELYAAERKSFQQDYTPQAVTDMLAVLVSMGNPQDGEWSGYDMTAGTGAMIISKWWEDMIQESPFSYAPHRYMYLAEELSDTSIPYLIHNLAMRGMNAIVIHGNSLEREVKQIYFIQNSKDDYLGFSDVNVMPHTEDVARRFGIRKWLEDEIDYKESGEVVIQYALPMQGTSRPTPNTEIDPKAYRAPDWLGSPRLKEIATLERAKKGKIYPKDSVVVQISATNGQVGMLQLPGKVESKYVVIQSRQGMDNRLVFMYLQLIVPWWFHRVKEGLNVKFEEIGNIPLHRFMPFYDKWKIRQEWQEVFAKYL